MDLYAQFETGPPNSLLLYIFSIANYCYHSFTTLPLWADALRMHLSCDFFVFKLSLLICIVHIDTILCVPGKRETYP